jgi:hypothetical protein
MKFFEDDWSTEKKVSFFVELLKEGYERIDNILVTLFDSLNPDNIVSSAKLRMTTQQESKHQVSEVTQDIGTEA